MKINKELLALFSILVFLVSCLQSTSTSPRGNPGDLPAGRPSTTPGDQGPEGSVRCDSPQSTFQCMMCNCHHETEGESYRGKVAVGKVVMTRVGMSEYPNSVCGVIYQHAQFSWTSMRVKRNETISGASYRNCYQAVQESLAFRGHFASHFHTPAVTPRWRKNCRVLERIGGHIFYESCRGYSRAPEGGGSEAVSKLQDPLIQDSLDRGEQYCAL